MRSVLVWLMGTFLLFLCHRLGLIPRPATSAELVVRDTADPLFEVQADVTIVLNGATATGSTSLDAGCSHNWLWQKGIRGVAGITQEARTEWH